MFLYKLNTLNSELGVYKPPLYNNDQGKNIRNTYSLTEKALENYNLTSHTKIQPQN